MVKVVQENSEHALIVPEEEGPKEESVKEIKVTKKTPATARAVSISTIDIFKPVPKKGM